MATTNVEERTTVPDRKRRGVVAIFVEVKPEHIAYWKFLFEAYEELAVVRTLDRKQAIIVVLAMDDFFSHVQAIVAEACGRTAARQIPPPQDLHGDWLLPELDT